MYHCSCRKPTWNNRRKKVQILTSSYVQTYLQLEKKTWLLSRQNICKKPIIEQGSNNSIQTDVNLSSAYEKLHCVLYLHVYSATISLLRGPRSSNVVSFLDHLYEIVLKLHQGGIVPWMLSNICLSIHSKKPLCYLYIKSECNRGKPLKDIFPNGLKECASLNPTCIMR